MMTERQVLHAHLPQLSDAELQWAWAYCDRMCREAGGNVWAMERFEARLRLIKAEKDRRIDENRPHRPDQPR